MVVTATQFKTNIGLYLDVVSDKKEVYITKNGKIAAKLSDPMQDKMSIINALTGIIPPGHISLEDAKTERILKRAYTGEDPYIVNERLEVMGRKNQAESIL